MLQSYVAIFCKTHTKTTESSIGFGKKESTFSWSLFHYSCNVESSAMTCVNLYSFDLHSICCREPEFHTLLSIAQSSGQTNLSCPSVFFSFKPGNASVWNSSSREMPGLWKLALTHCVSICYNPTLQYSAKLTLKQENQASASKAKKTLFSRFLCKIFSADSFHELCIGLIQYSWCSHPLSLTCCKPTFLHDPFWLEETQIWSASVCMSFSIFWTQISLEQKQNLTHSWGACKSKISVLYDDTLSKSTGQRI